jgi:hypothetical protein
MSVTLEVITLDGIDVDGSISCITYAGSWHCPNPAEFRIYSACKGCEHTETVFICGECRRMLEKCSATCIYCFAPRGIDKIL